MPTKPIKKELTITDKLNKIQKELKVGKPQYNNFGRYNYRNCDDILEAVKPLLNDCVLTLNDKLVKLGDRYYIQATAIIADNKSDISCLAYAREAEEKKGMDASQITGTASSYARKYALNGLFCIDDTKDADTLNNKQEINQQVQQVEPIINVDENGFTDEPFPDSQPTQQNIINNSGDTCVDCGTPLSTKVIEFSTKKYGKKLCFDCQKKQ